MGSKLRTVAAEPLPGVRITLEELSQRTGESPQRLLKWREAGLIGGEDGLFGGEDIGRAYLVHELLHYGHTTESIAKALNHPSETTRNFMDMLTQQMNRPMYSVGEAAEIAGIPVDQAKRLVETIGIAEAGEELDEEDIMCLRSCKVALDAGYPEEGLVQILRVFAESMRRAAEVSQRTSHFYLHQPLQQQLAPDVLWDRLENTFSKIEPLVEPALMYFYRKGSLKAGWDDLLMHLEEASGLAEPSETPGQMRRAIMFVDLVNFTPLAEAMGDIKAAEVLERFGQMVRLATLRCHGRVVKQIGDAFMIVFPECYSAVSCALELDQRATHEPAFPAVRVGLHWGAVLYREGDYIGSNVNISSRLAEEAQRHQILISSEVRDRAKEYNDAEFVRIGKRRLKGLAAEVEVFEVRLKERDLIDKVADPVCGMELGPGEEAALLTLDGIEHRFCSDDCLRKFVKSPEKYAA